MVMLQLAYQAVFVLQQSLAIHYIPARCWVGGLAWSDVDVKAVQGIVERPELIAL